MASLRCVERCSRLALRLQVVSCELLSPRCGLLVGCEHFWQDVHVLMAHLQPCACVHSVGGVAKDARLLTRAAARVKME